MSNEIGLILQIFCAPYSQNRFCSFGFLSEGFQNIDGGVIASLGRADLRSLYPAADGFQHLPRDGDPFLARRLWSRGLVHSFQDGVRHRNAQFVLHELGVARADQRPNARYYWDAAMLDVLQEILQQVEIENRLRHHIFGASFDFVLKTTDLFIEVGQARVSAHANHESRAFADRVSTQIQAAIQVVDNVYQPDGVDIEHRRGVGIIAHLRADRR